MHLNYYKKLVVTASNNYSVVTQKGGTSMVLNDNKKELITKICKNLNAKGFRDEPVYALDVPVPFSFLKGFGGTLKWLPIENIQKMADCDITNCNSFKEAYELWGRAGALKFQPYFVIDKGSPSLVVRRNRFLHMFRGYHFQVSGTIDGIGDYGSGAYRMDFLTTVPYYREMLHDGIIGYMLWWAALIDVGFTFDNFRDLFNNNIDVLNEFLNDTMNCWSGMQDRKWSDIEHYIKHETGNINVMTRKTYQLRHNNKSVVCYFAIGKKTIQVELAGSHLVTLTIPDLNDGVGYNLNNEADKNEYDAQVEILEKNHYIEMLLVMLLKLCNINISFNGWWPIGDKLTDMRPINSPDVVNVESLNEVYNAIPDMF